MKVGDLVRPKTCLTCDMGRIRALADDQALVDYPTHSTWEDLRDLVGND